MQPRYVILIAFALVVGACGSSGPTTIGSVERHAEGLDALVPVDAEIEHLADGFEWSEGPVWNVAGNYLLFSDIPNNTIYRWDETDSLQVYLRPAGYMWSDPPGAELGTNGLVYDAEGRLLMADHGNRQIARLDPSNFTRTTLAARYNGKRLSSPNDLVVHSSGDIYFTDPPYGLARLNEDPAKELSFNGVYRLRADGDMSLLTDELSFPNGIAFSPDERTLYVANSDPKRPIWMAFDVSPNGMTSNGRVFFDATELVRAGKQGMPDGMAVDRSGNIFATGPGGVLVFSPSGEHLGTIATGELIANVTFGGPDGSTLYMTSDNLLARIQTTTQGQ